MNKFFLFFCLNCLVILLIGTVLVLGQNTPFESVKDKSITLKMNHEPLGKIFRILMVKYDVAIGFEESSLDRDHNDYEFETILKEPTKKETTGKGLRISVETERIFDVKEHWITINVKDCKLEEVLNIIVEQMVNYSWEIKDDVVNIYPVKGRDKRFEELLKLNIKNYFVNKGEPFATIRNEIFSLPEIKEFLDGNKISFSSLRPDPEFIWRRLPNELNFSNIKFIDLLNEIVKAKRGGWIIKQTKIFRKQENEYIEISI